jgi:hypothetical protein
MHQRLTTLWALQRLSDQLITNAGESELTKCSTIGAHHMGMGSAPF